MVGQTISYYRITEKLGAGGMGEVYRATDSRLGREVALKVLPAAFASDGERMARFAREAQVLASLNHPNIAAIYGFEDAHETRALVMELVGGATLAERIRAGPVGLEEALGIARQIAEALEAAHERGVIHRDMKPGNVKVTPKGQVKVLDFGLARALEDDPAGADLAHSPTLTAAATKAGIILGTAAYMSPEQAKGKPVDRRADIWSFGVVLYEMLAGKQLYSGENASEILAAVIKDEPDWAALPADTPAPIRKLLRRCLTKDARRRLQAIGEARIAIEEYLANPNAESAVMSAVTVYTPGWRRVLPWGVAAVFFLASLVLLWSPWKAPKSAPPMRLSVEVGADASLGVVFGSSAILSPDGTRLAFVALDANQKRQIYVRSLDQLQATPLAGTDEASNPFFSPDGQWIAFFAQNKLKKVAVQGGAAVALCDVRENRGGSWSDDGTIVFAPDIRSGLFRVSSAGGAPQPLTTLDKKEATHRWPQVLPGGKAVLFTAHRGINFEDAKIVAQSLKNNTRREIHQGGFYARYLSSGHLVYMHEGTLFAAPFDLERLEMTGQPGPVVEGVMSNAGTGGAQFAFSEAGALVYLPGRGVAGAVSIYWMDRQGKLEPLRGVTTNYFHPRFSPDGKLLGVTIAEGGNSDVWVYDWARDTMTRFTFDPSSDGAPVWTPDGRRLAFRSERDASPGNIYWQRADGTGAVERLTDSKNSQAPYSWRPDGKVLAFAEESPETTFDIWMLPMEGDERSGWKPGKPEIFLNSPFLETSPAFSPDGHWLAYQSSESGSFEVYVRPFPAAGGKWQVSTGGGAFPKWSPNGRELFYRTPEQQLMVAAYTVVGNSFRADKPRLWSEGRFTGRGPFPNFDLHPDGKRFAVLKAPETQQEAARNKLTLILNFLNELRQRVPTGKD